MSTAFLAQLALRAATENDIAFLLGLWQVAMSEHFTAAGVPQAEENPMVRLLMRFECATIVSCEGRDIGLLKVTRDGCNWQLLQILLSPDVQKRGVGTCLIRAVIAEARSCGASLRLSVLKQNPAKNLYHRLGFKTVTEEQYAYNMLLDNEPDGHSLLPQWCTC
jgi:ribosomal protein S18 acetylase RimI-like enzyme